METIEARRTQALDPRVNELLLLAFPRFELPKGMNESQFYDRIDEIHEIVVCCEFGRREDLATHFVRDGLTLAEARYALCTIRAEQDEAIAIDTARRISNAAPDVWAARAGCATPAPGDVGAQRSKENAS